MYMWDKNKIDPSIKSPYIIIIFVIILTHDCPQLLRQ